MSGKWVTKALGKTPPIDNFDDVANEEVTLMIRGKNGFGDDIFSYLRLPVNQIETVRAALSSGDPFLPSNYGTVLAAGRGEPSQELLDEVGEAAFSVSFEPKTLPNIPPAPKIWD